MNRDQRQRTGIGLMLFVYAVLVVALCALVMAACTPKQLLDTVNDPNCLNCHPTTTIDPELDGPDNVVYVLDTATMQCYGIGSKYLAALPAQTFTRCDHQGPYVPWK